MLTTLFLKKYRIHKYIGKTGFHQNITKMCKAILAVSNFSSEKYSLETNTSLHDNARQLLYA
jgi:hypothetical protein